MTIRLRTSVRAAVVLAALLARAGSALAAEARFERVVLLPAPDRVSVVFELSAEPADVTTRRISAAVFELDAGAVLVPAAPTTYVAPAGIRFVSSIVVQGGGDGAAPARLKARIALAERSRSAVRVVGRRVYVDFSAGEPARPARPVRPDVPVAPAPRTQPFSDAPVPAAYHTSVKPAIERLDRLTPFLVSGTSAPTTSVLQALGTTLTDIDRSVRSMQVPAESRHVHALLSSAISLAMTAVDPAFDGDRAAQTRQALDLLDQAKQSL